MALTNRYSCLALPEILLTEYRFHIHYMEEGHPETPVKFRSRSNGQIKSYGPYKPLLLPGATRHPPHRVSIPHPLYGNGHPETPVKFRSRSNGRIKSYDPYEPLLLPGSTRHPPHRVSIPHPLYGEGHPETYVKFRSRSNGRIKSYGPYEPLLFPGATRVPPPRVSIPNPPYRKRASGNSCKIWIAIQRSDQKLWPLTNRYSCLARRDFLHTKNRFHIHYMEERHPETP